MINFNYNLTYLCYNIKCTMGRVKCIFYQALKKSLHEKDSISPVKSRNFIKVTKCIANKSII